MTMENQPFEDVSPIKTVDFPASHVSYRGSTWATLGQFLFAAATVLPEGALVGR